MMNKAGAMHRKSKNRHIESQHIDPFLEDIAKFLSSRTFVMPAREEAFLRSEENDQFSSSYHFVLDSSAADPI
jgi:erythromycin esterase-like protein